MSLRRPATRSRSVQLLMYTQFQAESGFNPIRIDEVAREVQDAIKDWAHAGWTPMRRRVTPADIANVCALICTEEASFLTGQTIVVDGGSSLMNPDFPLALQVPK